MGTRAGSSSPPLTRLTLVCLLFAFAAGLVAVTPTPAFAQEAVEGEKASAEEPNLFLHIITSAGPFFGGLMLLISICLVALIVLLAMDLRMAVAIPPQFVDEFTDLVNKRQFKQAYELCRSDNSFLARVMTAGMSRLQYGIEDAREAAFNQVDSVRAGKEQFIAYVGTIGTLGPMLGLVGTVAGMIESFMVLARPGSTPNASALAGGISHALVVTLLGIAISVPAIFCYSFFKNRLTRIAMDSAGLADDLLTQMYHNSKKAAAATAPAPTPVPAAPVAPPPRGDQRAIRPSE